MDFENDYILRLIKTMVRALSSLIFGRQMKFHVRCTDILYLM